MAKIKKIIKGNIYTFIIYSDGKLLISYEDPCMQKIFDNGIKKQNFESINTNFLGGNKIKNIYTNDHHAFLVDDKDKIYVFGDNSCG